MINNSKENVKILVVEDEHLTYHAVKVVLEESGVLCFTNSHHR